MAIRATWGEPLGTEDRSRHITLLDWRPVRKKTLRGFCSIQLLSALQITNVAVHVRGGRAWVSLPAVPMLDAEGRQVIRDGRPQYVAIIRWCDRDLAERFSAAVVELVRAAYPDTFNESGAGDISAPTHNSFSAPPTIVSEIKDDQYFI